MKVKILGIILAICFMVLLVPNIVLGYENKDSLKEQNITYQLFDDGTAKVVYIEDDTINGYLHMWETVGYNGEYYKITSIDSNAFDGVTTEYELNMYGDNSPKLELNASLEKISAIYIPIGYKDTYVQNGWPEAKLKNYKIKTQPQDVVVTAGEIDTTLEVTAEVKVALQGEGITYTWYYADKDGNIKEKAYLDSANIPYKSVYKVPTDLSYDHENNKEKDYYLVCVVGEGREGAILEKTRPAKITVKPGTYKVEFNSGYLAEWIAGTSYIVPVNSDRKIEKANIPSVDKLKIDGNGLRLKGWALEDDTIIDPATFVYDKNTTLYPVWEYDIIFNACGGLLDNGLETYKITTTNHEYDFYDTIINMSNPTRNGYKFVGFFDQETGGKKLEYYIYEEGIEEGKTFYARWEKIEEEDNTIVDNENKNNDDIDSNNNENDETNNNEQRKTSNPKTDDNILAFVGMAIVSLLGIVTTIKFKRSK